MQNKSFVVLNKLGLHARPAALLTKTANLFPCTILLKKGAKSANAKSILGVMSLGAKSGEQIDVECDGENETVALESIQALFEERFGEDQ